MRKRHDEIIPKRQQEETSRTPSRTSGSSATAASSCLQGGETSSSSKQRGAPSAQQKASATQRRPGAGVPTESVRKRHDEIMLFGASDEELDQWGPLGGAGGRTEAKKRTAASAGELGDEPAGASAGELGDEPAGASDGELGLGELHPPRNDHPRAGAGGTASSSSSKRSTHTGELHPSVPAHAPRSDSSSKGDPHPPPRSSFPHEGSSTSKLFSSSKPLHKVLASSSSLKQPVADGVQEWCGNSSFHRTPSAAATSAYTAADGVRWKQERQILAPSGGSSKKERSQEPGKVCFLEDPRLDGARTQRRPGGVLTSSSDSSSERESYRAIPPPKGGPRLWGEGEDLPPRGGFPETVCDENPREEKNVLKESAAAPPSRGASRAAAPTRREDPSAPSRGASRAAPTRAKKEWDDWQADQQWDDWAAEEGSIRERRGQHLHEDLLVLQHTSDVVAHCGVGPSTEELLTNLLTVELE